MTSLNDFRPLIPAVLLALAASQAPAVAQEPADPRARQEAKAEAERERRQAKAEAAEAKREKKREKDQASSKPTREQKRRELIESGAKTALEWYGEALGLYKSGRYLDARAILLPLEDSARAVDIQEKVKLLIADTYFEQGGALNLAEALARYKSFLTFFPSSENAAYAQFQLGRSYFKQLGHPDRDQSYTDQAIFEYQKLIENYPDSEHIEQAKKDVLEARARRAQHEFEVAQFYWDWNDKGAAAQRLKQVLKERPELPAREKALWMAAQALYDTGQREEADAYAARLAADYPGSPYIGRLDPKSTALKEQEQRKRKEDKVTERTAKALAQQDRRRTRMVRKDSGLPGDVPQTWDLSGSTTPVPAAAATPAAAPDNAAVQKQQQRDEAQRAQAAKLEAEEQARAAKQAERDGKKEAQREKEAAERAAKEAKKAEELAAETPQQKAEREKREAKAKAEADRLEAEEQKAAEKQAEADRKRRAKQDAEAAKKAKKKGG